MANRFYLINSPAEYIPPVTALGAWTVVPPGHPVILLDPIKIDSGFSNFSAAEGVFAGTSNTLLFRGVTGKLRAQNIHGTAQIVIGTNANELISNYFSHVLIYATVGDTSAIRTVLGNFTDLSGTEWSNSGRAIWVVFDIDTVDIEHNDRLVVEFGYHATNSSGNPSASGDVRYGTNASSNDLFPGDTQASIHAAYVNFGIDIQLIDVRFPAIVSHVVTQVAYNAPPPPQKLSHIVTQVASFRPPSASTISQVIVQSAYIPPSAPSVIGHVIAQVVPTPAPKLPDVSGLYFLNSSKSGHHDSYYHSVELKIPDPTIRTALLGE